MFLSCTLNGKLVIFSTKWISSNTEEKLYIVRLNQHNYTHSNGMLSNCHNKSQLHNV